MSELKEYEVRIGRKLYQTLPPIVYVVADDNQPKLLNDKVYLKSEADKVIAEKDAEIVELKDKLQNVSELLTETREWLIESQKMHQRCADGAIKKIRHNKYKRCLAMAKYCDASMAYFGEFYDSASERMVAHYYKWRSRWYELAEKFKEAK